MARREQLTLESLFEPDAPRAGSMNMALELRNALSDAVRASGLSRAQIAARMTDLIWGDASDGEITKAQLDAWTAPSRGEWRFPLEYLAAFVLATGATDILKLIAGKAGCLVMPSEQAKVMELAALKMRQEQLAKTARRLKDEVTAEDVNAFLSEVKGKRR